MPKFSLGILGLHEKMTVPVERQKINRSFSKGIITEIGAESDLNFFFKN